MRMKMIFFASEFTELATNKVKFLSMAFVTEMGKELHIKIKQPSKAIDPWTEEHVLPFLKGEAVTEEEAIEIITDFIEEEYGENQPVLVADDIQSNWEGIQNLFGAYHTPFCMQIGLRTILAINSIDIYIDRIELAKELGINVSNFKKHNTLEDARVSKSIFCKLAYK